MSHKRSAAMKKYCKQVKGMLHCSSNTKDILLSGLLDELEEAGKDQKYEELVRRFGQPEDVAKQLQDSVGNEEFRRAVTRKRCNKRAMIAFVVVLVGLLVGTALYARYIWDSIPVKVIEEIHEGVSLIGTPVD